MTCYCSAPVAADEDAHEDDAEIDAAIADLSRRDADNGVQEEQEEEEVKEDADVVPATPSPARVTSPITGTSVEHEHLKAVMLAMKLLSMLPPSDARM